MTVRRSPRGKWMIDINYNHPDGKTSRIRKVSPVQSRRGAELHERELRLLLQAGMLKEGDDDEEGEHGSERTTRASKMSEFVEVFLDEHSRTEGLRPTYIRGQRAALEQHVVPVIGDEPMDEIGTKHFGLIKRAMLKKNPDYSGKTVNNVLGVLSKMVRFWWEREGLDAPHFRVGLLKLDEREAHVYDREVYERLVAGAGECGPIELAMVLLMGDGGLRQGELRGLHRADVHFEPKPAIRVQRALSLDGEEHPPKGRRNRTVPMTSRLAAAIRAIIGKRQTSDYVFVREDDLPLTASAVRARVKRAELKAGIVGKGRSHVMRHTFVTHLAESNASPRVIQELAGHTELKTTLRYMHMRNEAAHDAIAALESDRSRTQQESAQTRRSQRHHSGTALE